jgi:AraC-like DNA-binding protein
MPSGRQVLNLSDVGLPDVPVLGRYEYSTVHPGLAAHAHPKCIEIVFLHHGCQTYSLGGRRYELHGGDIFLTRPGESHDTGGEPEARGVLYWLNLVITPRHESCLMLPKADADLLKRQLLGIPERQFTGSPLLKTLLDEIFVLHADAGVPLTRLEIANRIVRWLLEVLACARRQRETAYSDAIAAVLREIETQPQAAYPAARLAERAGLSVSRFKARFRSETGIAPHEFVLRAKVEAARRMLQAPGASITAVAYGLGFSSSQYFATVFKRFTTLTPREFRHIRSVKLRPGEDLYQKGETRW